MGVSDILEIGRQGLAANRQALQTTAHNVANANTPGYSRQRPVLQSRERWTTDSQSVGGGVEVAKVIRIHDAFIEKRIWEEAKEYGRYRMQADGIKRIEGLVYNDGGHMGELMNRFFNDFRELSLNPESSTIRSSIANSADITARGFRKLNDSLESMQADTDVALICYPHQLPSRC
jgi:flagellar hook-associated protein 1 FlgK